jgi:S-(hydroxymethyl)glutathione dehydrogenase / alcohol dehydrogenase
VKNWIGDSQLTIECLRCYKPREIERGSLYGSSRPRIDILNLIEMHQSGKLLLDELLTRTYPLEDINTAYAALERGEVARSLVLA